MQYADVHKKLVGVNYKNGVVSEDENSNPLPGMFPDLCNYLSLLN